MALKQTVTATEEVEIEIKPAVRRKLLTELKAYDQLAAEKKAIEHAMSKHKDSIGQLREQTGVKSLELEGFKVTLVEAQSRKLDKKKFVALGGSLKMLENATVSKPKKPFEKITCPGEQAEQGEEE